MFRVDFSVTPTVSTTSTQTNLGREGPPILTTTVQYVPSVIVPCTSSDSSGTTITQTVIPQVIYLINLIEMSALHNNFIILSLICNPMLYIYIYIVFENGLL